MTKTIQIADNYQTLDDIIKTFNKSFLNYSIIPVFLTVFIFSLILFIDIHFDDIDYRLSHMLYGVMSFFLMVITFSLSASSIFMSIAQYFTDKQYFVTSYKTHYQNTLTDIEKSFLENLLNDKFDNIIQDNRKVIKKKLRVSGLNG